MVDGREDPVDRGHAASPLRLLLVEPDPRAALWIGEMARAGWPGPLLITHAERLTDAARHLAAAAADCVVVDARQLRGEATAVLSPAARVPLLALTGADDGSEEAEIAALRAGAQAVLAKDELHPRALRRALRQAIVRNEAEADLVHRALHDSLTGLPNRALFLDRLRVALDRARRSGARVAVLFLDVDRFKEVNDTRGHGAGDALLGELADRLRVMLRPMDTVARFGGDEFTLLFEELADEHEVLLIAERITRACRVPVAAQGEELTVTVSVGVAVVADPSVSAADVVREADAAMYRAKEQGGGRYEISDEATRTRAGERRAMQLALARAIPERRLRVHYQPEFSLEGGREITGLEALLRWEHPERGLLPAGDFLPLAEESGLMLEIGRYVVAEVLRALAGWRAHRAGIRVSINLSLRELEDLGIVEALGDALRSAEVEPEALGVEVAERALVRNPAGGRRILQGLRRLGVGTAIDGYGTAGSSVLGLGALPVDALKLDRSLLEAAEADGAARAPVLPAVVGLAHALGLRVTAQGVETEAQVDELRAAGCDRAQGYRFAAPMPEADVSPLLAAEGCEVG